MSFIIVPQIVTSDTIMLWVAAIGEKVRETRITVDYRQIEDKTAPFEEHLLRSSEWRMWKTRQVLDSSKGGERNSVIYYQRIIIGSRIPLTPGTKYLFYVKWDKVSKPDAEVPDNPDDKHLGSMQDFSRRDDLYVPEPATDQRDAAVATATTLPLQLPGLSDPKPFTVMLGSCFYRPADPDGLAGQTFFEMPRESRPDLKILCGDQVYLDNPWFKTTLNVLSWLSPKENIRQLFFKKYLQNWTQMALMKKGDKWAVGGFNVLLRHGANYFASDDHEFWNNAPNWGVVGTALTLFGGQKRFWFREGSDLFKIFQSPSPWMTFDVSPISFCIADTRINRDVNSTRFMEDDDLDAIRRWIENLHGPGVLSLGQPILSEKGSLFGRVFDRGLADYDRRFNELKVMIQNSKYSIVLLTGDVHFGRYSECPLRKPTPGDTNVPKFVEVISSPLRIVDGFFGRGKINGYEDAFDTFATGVKSIPIADHQNHFVTLEFTQDAVGTVTMKVMEWPIPNTTLDKTRFVSNGKEVITVELT